MQQHTLFADARAAEQPGLARRDERRPTLSGRTARVWIATSAGRQAVAA